MTPRFRLFGFLAPQGFAPRSTALVRAIAAHLAALVLAMAVVFTASSARAAGDGEHPGPGQKIVRSTVGTAPQALTDAEKAKLAASAVAPPAPVSTLKPAPWLPPGWRAQFLNGGIPVRATASRSHVRGAPHDVAGRPAHVTPSGAKPAAVRTIGYGPRDASQAEIDSKKAATTRPDGNR